MLSNIFEIFNGKKTTTGTVMVLASVVGATLTPEDAGALALAVTDGLESGGKLIASIGIAHKIIKGAW